MEKPFRGLGVMQNYLDSVKRIFLLYKQLGEKAMAQVDDKELSWQQNEDSNSIITIVKHMWGNMLSRWTDFLTSDGEKPWRQRDAEFEAEVLDRVTIMKKWDDGWQCLFDAIDGLTDKDLDTIIYIRNEGQSVMDAINRQIAHYSYHVGQIVYIAKMREKQEWKSLTIPRNKSNEYNAGKFAQEKQKKNFTDDLLEKK